jgi:hypothetical protein
MRPRNLGQYMLCLTLLYDGGDPKRVDAFAVASMDVVDRSSQLEHMSQHLRVPREWADPSIGIIQFRLNFVPHVQGLTLYAAFPNVLKREELVINRMGVIARERMIIMGLGQ